MSITERLFAPVSRGIRELDELWDKIGLDKNSIEERQNATVSHVSDLMELMVKEEQENMEEICRKKENIRNNCNSLEKELDYKEELMLDGLSLLEIQSRLNRYLDTLTAIKAKRMEVLDNMIKQEEELLSALGKMDKFPVFDKIPTDDELTGLKNHLQILQTEINNRKECAEILRSKIKAIMNELQLDPQSGFEIMVVGNCDFQVTDTNMNSLREMESALLEKKRQNELLKDELIVTVSGLWNRLNVQAFEREFVLNQCHGLSQSSIEALQAEVERCIMLRKQSMMEYIPKLKMELKNMWDICKFEDERQFGPYYSDQYTEEIATALEHELERITIRYDEYRGIYELANTRSNLLEELSSLETKANDPGRLFNNRGGKLLQEQKQKKNLMKRLQIIERELKLLLQKYENEKNECFIYDGKNLLEIIQDSINKRNIKKDARTCLGSNENLVANRLTPRPATPFVKHTALFNKNTPVTTPRSAPRSAHVLGKENKSGSSQRKRVIPRSAEGSTSYAAFEVNVKKNGNRSTPECSIMCPE